jgi:superfamily I DNA and/or RNA helicase
MHASGAAGSHRCVKIDTVDSFQGSEADIIILSFVRSSSSIGFLRDFRRLNVALTRARKALFVVCDTKSLAGALPSHVAQLIRDAQQRQLVYDAGDLGLG